MNNWSIENNSALVKEILDIPVNLQQAILKDLSAKLLSSKMVLTCENRYKLVACKL